MEDLPVLEYGRYRIRETPDGGWLLSRAVDICDRCESCGCGDQAEPVIVPGMLVRAAEAMQNGNGHSPLAAARRLMRRGTIRRNGDESSGGSEAAAEGDDIPGADLAGVSAAGHADQAGGGGSGDGRSGSAGEV